MNKLLLGLAAAAAFAITAPAFAHEGDDGSDEVFAAQTYADFTPMYQHIWQGIQHGLSDGSYSRWQARRFYGELQSIRQQAWYGQRNGAYNPGQVNARLQRLHDSMHNAHAQGHERLNNDWNNGYNNGYDNRYNNRNNNGYNNGYDNRYDNRNNNGYNNNGYNNNGYNNGSNNGYDNGDYGRPY